MKPRCYGKIVNLSGGGATAPRPRLSAYAASKAAVVRLTETLAEELREFRKCDCPCRPEYTIAPGSVGGGSGRGRRGLLQQSSPTERIGRCSTGEGSASLRVPGVRRERWTHRKANQCPVGSVGQVASMERSHQRKRCVHAPANGSGRPWTEVYLIWMPAKYAKRHENSLALSRISCVWRVGLCSG
jgi:hypothetical protein